MFFFLCSWNEWKGYNELTDYGACDTESNGTLRYYQWHREVFNKDFVNKGTQTSFPQDKGHENWEFYSDDNGVVFIFAGSFCGKGTETYTMEVYGDPAIYLYVHGFGEWKYTNNDYCDPSSYTASVSNITNKCAPFIIQIYAENNPACHNPCFNFHIKDSAGNDHSAFSNLYPCKKDACFDGMTGTDCSIFADNKIFCNKNGYADWGKHAFTDKCVCNNNNYGNDFCEDTTSSRFKSPGLSMEILDYLSSSQSPPATIPNFSLTSDSFIDYPYSKVNISGYLYVPQETDLDFKLESHPNAKLTVYDGNTVKFTLGSINTTVDCNPMASNIVEETPETLHFTNKTYWVNLEFYPGCSINNPRITLYWKFYRWHKNDATWGYEEIPERYFGTTSNFSW